MCVRTRNGRVGLACLDVYREAVWTWWQSALTPICTPLPLACVFWARQWARHMSWLLGLLKRSWRSGLWVDFQAEQPVSLSFVAGFWIFSSRALLFTQETSDCPTWATWWFYENEIYRTFIIFLNVLIYIFVKDGYCVVYLVYGRVAFRFI